MSLTEDIIEHGQKQYNLYGEADQSQKRTEIRIYAHRCVRWDGGVLKLVESTKTVRYGTKLTFPLFPRLGECLWTRLLLMPSLADDIHIVKVISFPQNSLTQ